MKSSVALVFGAAVIGASAAVSSVCYCGTGNGNEVNEELTFLACEAVRCPLVHFFLFHCQNTCQNTKITNLN